ncbi:transglycosylase domain-containing protein [Herbiconiux sp. L3-i23]|uniref:transglycosylase domain-containing protein n=1 Tax=Herbiconiux sp. L3-i23 TaxID=2905871 RepID=UPI00205E8D5A|nr:transglycosylase domain-containing protein [Herbiconiux sp. L3-i23]BDI22434.1 carboxypeptidase [Herbiconiux sp. L3-i23]
MSFPRTPSRIGGLLGFIGMSAAAGVLATVAVTPAIALTSVAASDTIGIFEDLPDYLEIQPLSQRTNIYATNSDGSPLLLAYFYNQNRIEVSADQVNGFVKDAAVAGEDPRYYDHGGVDLQGTIRAVLNTYILGGSVQGGSSITQQYVKNVNIQNAIKDLTDQAEITAAYEKATETTESRKIQEMKYAIGLEKRYSKDEVLMGYLNIAGFGGRIYGIEAAANYYFGTSAANASLPQAASLMAIVNNPEKFRLDYPDSETNGAANGYADNKQRRDYILRNMLSEGMITQQEHDDAVAAPVEPSINAPTVGCSAALGSGFFCDYVTRVFKNDEFFGADENERWRNFVTAGYDVYTTLDVDLQIAAEQAINDNVPMHLDDFNVGASVVTVEPGTGKIRAMAQNKIFSDDPEVLAVDNTRTAVNFNADFDYGASTGFQPGSTYKIFTLLEWLKEGHGINESVNGQLRDYQGQTWKDSCSPGGTYTLGESWRPRNDEGDNPGNISALQSTMTSKNTGFIAMSKQLDLCGIRDTASSMGVYRADKDAIINYETGELGTGELARNPSSVLGTNEVAPLQMAGAFATIASGGTYCEPIAIERIVAPDGSDVPVPPVTCTKALEPDVAAAAAFALQRAFEGGTGASTANRLTTDAPTLGKTGTTDEAYATWMSGATTRAATVVGVYNVSGFVNQRKYDFDSGEAATARHRIAPRVMSVANAKWGGDPFPDPSSALLRGQTVSVPDVRGLSIDQAKAIIEGAGFTFEDGGQQDSELPVGTVTGTNPSGTAGKGAIVSVYTSNGSLRAVPNLGGLAPAAVPAAWAAAGFTSVPGGVCQANPAVAEGPGTVTAQDPPPGTAARPDVAVTVTVTRRAC